MIIRTTLVTSALIFVAASAALAEGLVDTPRVVADIVPIHSLVARVVAGIGSPELIVQQSASPHEYALRPSQAEILEAADLVFWVGEDLTPWLARSLRILASDAAAIELLEVDGTTRLNFRKSAIFADHAEAEHLDEHSAEEDHDHERSAGKPGAHSHIGIDPHAWLDPDNGKLWLAVIAAELARVDPANASTYYQNAVAGKREIDTATAKIKEILKPLRRTKYIVSHDAYHYFENYFDLASTGSVALSDASAPSPARISKIKNKIAALGIACVLVEPLFNPGLIAAVMEGTEAKVSVVDPLGLGLDLGAKLYLELLYSLAEGIANCN